MKLKEVVIWSIGVLTLVYSLTEIGVALWFSSYALLSDGFHNLSDVFSLYITYWASKASRRARSDQMSYGWARTEILGALTNGIFLLSLCLYTTLEVIPELVEPEPEESGWYFIGVAAAGLALNTMATVLLCLTGQAHAHSHAGGSGHGHSHGGSHGHDEKKKKHKHGHSEEEAHSHKKKKHKEAEHELLLVNEDHHDHEAVKDTHSHSHSHAGDHPHKKKKKKKDLNMRATIIHFFGDMISSFFVLIAGLLIEFGGTGKWVDYIDPVTSLVICLLILITTLPLVRSCFNILLQKTPSSINLNETRDIINKLPGVLNVHDFHVWQLTDGMIITSLHIMCADGCDFAELSKKIKKILHKRGIHSPTIQPEFVPSVARVDTNSCLENCVEDCKEDWCCKTEAPPPQRRSASH